MPGTRNLDRGTANRIQARAFALPFLEKIGPLVKRAVFLETIGSCGHDRRPGLVREADLLANEAREDLRHLDRQLAALPAEITGHSHIVDARKALVAVVDRFERARLAL